MKLEDVKALAKKGESDVLEFKKSTSKLKESFQALCGMLNGVGGQVLVGVKDSGKIEGQTISDNTN
jgi:ATP-dependent DNA helicase RecG